MTAIADLPVVERLRFILGSLRTFLGARGFFVFGHNVALICVLVNGLTRRAQRFARLVAAIEAGTPRPATTDSAASPDALSSPRAERSGPSLRLRSRFDWLRRRLQQGMGSRFDAWNFANHFLCLRQPDFLRLPRRTRAR
ncbi:MAG: hypothetical protein JOY70_09500, partial [Acidisphaera sp.]|nr:hypothetical protein [Acidisphaera sp.]